MNKFKRLILYFTHTSQFLIVRQIHFYLSRSCYLTISLIFQIFNRFLDNTIGAVFEVKLTDVNNDGKTDLLVTNNGNNGSVFVYEIPEDFR